MVKFSKPQTCHICIYISTINTQQAGLCATTPWLSLCLKDNSRIIKKKDFGALLAYFFFLQIEEFHFLVLVWAKKTIFKIICCWVNNYERIIRVPMMCYWGELNRHTFKAINRIVFIFKEIIFYMGIGTLIRLLRNKIAYFICLLFLLIKKIIIGCLI